MISVSPHIVCFRANNPSAMTLDGTNCYVVFGRTEAFIVDAGPEEAPHLTAMAEFLRSKQLNPRGILLTHTHNDHTAGLATLRQYVDAPVYAFKEGYDRTLVDGQRIPLEAGPLVVIHTPGHAGDCVCFFHEQDGVLIAGDTVLGSGTSVISPPEGDVSDYLDALERLKKYPAKIIAPGHGPMISDPAAKLDEYIKHRLMRERQIVAELQDGPKTVDELVAEIYEDVDKSLHGAAGWSVRAHLKRLERAGQVREEAGKYEIKG
jgi:glyoxylase-like metal-dependent hydrolase (beta-lactamase superfamily II)